MQEQKTNQKQMDRVDTSLRGSEIAAPLFLDISPILCQFPQAYWGSSVDKTVSAFRVGYDSEDYSD